MSTENVAKEDAWAVGTEGLASRNTWCRPYAYGSRTAHLIVVICLEYPKRGPEISQEILQGS